MTAVRWLTRAAVYGTLGAALVLICLVGLLWPAYGPQGLWTVAWLAVLLVTIAGSGAALGWLGDRRRTRASGPCPCPCPCTRPGERDDDGTPGWCLPCRMEIHVGA